VRGHAFIKALELIESAIDNYQKQGKNFVGIIGMHGTFRIVEERPLPHRATCDARDWESYKKVCEAEGVLAFIPKALL
jgi:hypothetical protein